LTDSALSLADSDLRYVIETVLPERSDVEHLLGLLRDDEAFIEAMLADPRLFERVMADEAIGLRFTPTLFFHVLLCQAHKDLRQAHYTVELRDRQKIPVFDSHAVVDLLSERPMRQYLAEMLASFTRIRGFTYPVRVRRGVWYKQRFSDLDIDSLIRLCQSVEEHLRFGVYKRIADVCLFIAGMFPEYAQPSASTAWTGRGRRDLEDYEQEGRQFYELAAEHEGAALMELRDVLRALSQGFTLAEKPLTFLSELYMPMRRHTLFAASARD
jgi:hypothetical protein